MARVSLDPPRSVAVRAGEWYSRRRFGDALHPALAMANNRRVFRTYVREELGAKRWKAVPGEVKTLAVLSAAATVGCAWCLDFGYWQGIAEGIDPAKIHDIAQWRSSHAYTDVERAVIEYAEVMSTTPPLVTDEHCDQLRPHFDDAQIVELTMMIAIENQRSRFNLAIGLTSQGFAERCDVKPLP